MIVTAMLPWFDEPAELLAQAVASVAVVADRLVAVDGGYALRPRTAARSPRGQAEAIREAAEAHGLDVDVVVPDEVWTGQCAKRDFLLKRAGEGSDWVVWLDADWVWLGDRDSAREELAAAGEAVVLQVPFTTPYDGARPLDEVASTDWHAQLANRTISIDVVYRALPGMRCGQHHWWVAGDLDGETVALWGWESVLPPAPRVRAWSGLRIEHRCFDRDDERILAGRAYAEARQEQVSATGVEA